MGTRKNEAHAIALELDEIVAAALSPLSATDDSQEPAPPSARGASKTSAIDETSTVPEPALTAADVRKIAQKEAINILSYVILQMKGAIRRLHESDDDFEE